MKSLRAPWKCRAMETVENQRQVSHCSHSAWKSLSRFPHSHRAGGAWKSAKPKPGFALSHLLSCFLSSHTGSALCDHAIQMGLLAAISVTHVAGLKCYPCPRPYNGTDRGQRLANRSCRFTNAASVYRNHLKTYRHILGDRCVGNVPIPEVAPVQVN
jgi:hypothetical protein